jgi:hypothetical protein
MTIVGRPITSRQDAAYFLARIEPMPRVVDALDGFASIEDRRQVESLSRGRRSYFARRRTPNKSAPDGRTAG